MTVSACRSQRGVGWTQVEKPPLEIRYFFTPIFSTLSPKKYTLIGWLDEGGAAGAPGRGCCRGGCTVATPQALKNVPRRVWVLNSARSAERRFSPCAKTTLPEASARLSSPYTNTSSA